MPEPSLGIVVVMPCFNEPDVETSVRALAQCYRPFCAVEVIVVVNFGEHVDEQVKAVCYQNYNDVQKLSAQLSNNQFNIRSILKENLPCKTAGVGLARKIGMDEAAYRFMLTNNPQGIVACFDADAVCDSNYFVAIEEHYKHNSTLLASSIYYEHPLQGNDFTNDIYQGIAQYELHLRYYNQALLWAGLPFAYHTVGSSMVCTAGGYAKVGGMNKRKAGEDFYFLQKLIQLGQFSEINSTRVIPSPRLSDRVPFGTGRAMLKYVGDGQPEMYTYSLQAFEALRQLVLHLPVLYRSNLHTQQTVLQSLHPYLVQYLNELDYHCEIDELNGNCADYDAFEKRFFKWFDAFRVLKFMNWVHDEDKWLKSTVVNAANQLLLILKNNASPTANAKDVLLVYRAIERGVLPV